MASGSFTSNTGTNLNLYVTWSSTTNVSANTSSVTANVYMRSYTINATALADSYITINGNKKSFAGISLDKTSSSLTNTLLTTHTVTVDHNSDGTKSITIKANLEFNGTVSGKYLTDVTASQTVSLDTIPRASGLTVASSINTGSSLTATITPASSTFTHKIEYYVGGVLKADSGSIAAGTKTYSRTIDHSWLPSVNSAPITVRLLTYNSGTEVGRVDKSVEATVPSTIIPVVNSITPTVVNGLGGYYVEGKSQVKLTVSATAGSGSTLSSYVFSGQNISGNASTLTSTSATVTSSVIKADGKQIYGVIAKDGRPNRQSAQATASVEVYPYANPQITSIAAQRCLADGTLSNDGTYAKVTVKVSYSPVNGANTRVVTLYSSKDNYATGTVVLAAADTSDTYTGVYGSDFAIGSNYTIRAVITDAYNTGTAIQKSATLGVAERILNIAKYGNGLSIGGLSTITSATASGLFECNWTANFNRPVKFYQNINGNMLFTNNNGVRAMNMDGRDISLIRVNSQNTLVIGEASGGGVSQVSMDGVYGSTSTAAANMLVDNGNKLYRSTSSSQRYKTDINDIQSVNLNPEKLYNLSVKEFKFKDGYIASDDQRYDMLVPGFIAEEVAEIYPIACEYSDGKPEDWNIRFMVPAMLKLIQNQKNEIEMLKAEINNIKNTL